MLAKQESSFHFSSEYLGLLFKQRYIIHCVANSYLCLVYPNITFRVMYMLNEALLCY